MIRINVDGGLQEGEVGYETQQRLVAVFQEALQLHERKSAGYGNAWWEQGSMGNLARVLSKAARLKNMLWRDMPLADSSESVTDTALDLINLGGFFIMNTRDGNRWGHGRG